MLSYKQLQVPRGMFIITLPQAIGNVQRLNQTYFLRFNAYRAQSIRWSHWLLSYVRVGLASRLGTPFTALRTSEQTTFTQWLAREQPVKH